MLFANSRLGDVIQKFKIQGPSSVLPASHFAVFPLAFARKLNNLRRIDLISISWNLTAFHSFFFLALSEFTSVTVLNLYDVQFSSFRQAIRLVCAFPNLRELDCTRLTWCHGYIPTAHELMLHRKFTRQLFAFNLGVHGGLARDILTFLIESDMARTLRRLTTSHYQVHLQEFEKTRLGETFCIAGANLEKLELVLQATLLDSAAAEDIIQRQGPHLAQLTRLRTLRIELDQVQGNVCFDWIPTLLGLLPSTHMQHIALQLGSFFHLQPAGTDVLDCVLTTLSSAWCQRVDGVLSQPRFRLLEKLTIEVRGHSRASEGSAAAVRWHVEFMARLPQLRERGVLAVILDLV
ncbi:uncharacterized protein FIBRA_05425 [Fibroporia radiculosa]|uniref:F-box domain-containing protein n=1 Tax=Fibroporia radiculosa TaxID=599839 RepID=J4HXH9_9APHY|nr:uncharacterized protein FIBRA_05425 [Fibroporia radiculosa]CCM03297.1 predicted protein [Fibroporia radiculosa]